MLVGSADSDCVSVTDGMALAVQPESLLDAVEVDEWMKLVLDDECDWVELEDRRTVLDDDAVAEFVALSIDSEREKLRVCVGPTEQLPGKRSGITGKGHWLLCSS